MVQTATRPMTICRLLSPQKAYSSSISRGRLIKAKTVLSCNLDTLHMDASGPPTLKLTPNLEPGVAIAKVTNLSANRDHGFASEWRSPFAEKDALDVLIKVPDEFQAKEQHLGRFEIDKGKISFNWDDDASSDPAARILLRNSVLEITTNEKNVSYALLRERPDENEYTEPLTIRMKARTKGQETPYYPLDKSATRPKYLCGHPLGQINKKSLRLFEGVPDANIRN